MKDIFNHRIFLTVRQDWNKISVKVISNELAGCMPSTCRCFESSALVSVISSVLLFRLAIGLIKVNDYVKYQLPLSL
jgi:hypothetical protein